MKKVGSLLILACFILTSSCATILSTSEWPVRIGSTPEQADVTITDIGDGKKIHTGKTPTIVTLSSRGGYFRGKSYTVQVSKEGFETQTVEINSALNGWYIGNIVFGGLLGILIIDPLTGAMWTLDPNEIDLTLVKKTAGLPSDQRALSVVSVEDVPDRLRDKMIKIR